VRTRTDEFENIDAAPAVVESIRTSRESAGDAVTTPNHTASTARRQIHPETLGIIAEQVGESELADARMVNDCTMGAGERPELLGRAGNRWSCPAYAELCIGGSTSGEELVSSCLPFTSIARSLRRRNGRSQGIASKRMDCVI